MARYSIKILKSTQPCCGWHKHLKKCDRRIANGKLRQWLKRDTWVGY